MRNLTFIFIIVTISLLSSGINPAFAEAASPLSPGNPQGSSPTSMGPENFPPGFNPLTGLQVTNPDNLSNPPALVSVTNWPHTARPQAGLSFSPMVFEVYIGEGMSRFLALFYGEYPSEAKSMNEVVVNSNSPAANAGAPAAGSNNSSKTIAITADEEATIGPIRSGRLFYEHIRKAYNGFLIMASAYQGVAKNLGQFANVFGSDEGNINSAMIKVSNLETIAQANRKDLGGSTFGMRFDPTPPEGGVTANSFWFFYNILNQIVWKYNSTTGFYERFQFTQEQHNTFIQATDRLNKEPLAYSNIIVLFANHRACKETAFDIDLLYVKRGNALLFRDGQMFKMNWTTLSGDYERKTGKLRPIRYMDDKGEPFPMKPGQTWVYIVPTGSGYAEVRDADKLDNIIDQSIPTESSVLYDMIQKKLPGSGTWAMRYFASLLITDPEVCKQLH